MDGSCRKTLKGGPCGLSLIDDDLDQLQRSSITAEMIPPLSLWECVLAGGCTAIRCVLKAYNPENAQRAGKHF